MPEMRVSFEVWCDCGEGLCNGSEGGASSVTVAACDKCVEAGKEEGREEGHEEGRNEGHDEGYSEGWESRNQEVADLKRTIRDLRDGVRY
jgi:hypothetical protein